ncbi:MAG: integrase core domain-containing protein [Thermoplasmataceae archaeon]|jgi:transposase InsO family protein|nr:MAG: hypothetical protein AMDU2_EPLC00008G0056 [Thermoplasmatales archaeon E-plasma]
MSAQFMKEWVSYEFSRTYTGNDCIKAVESVYSNRFPDGNPGQIVLRTDNGPQYVSEIFKTTVKHLGIRSEYIQKHTPEDNRDIESFHNSLKTANIWITDIKIFENAKSPIEYVFKDYNTIRPHSSISFLPPDEFERRWNESDEFRNDLKLSDRKYHCSICRLIMDLDTNVAIII